ncbi:efflux RND transporter periplasmic adaptor subunit [Teredinibacter waterburyi]|jgi:RND family efflux transporter, MFP subunit|uniref:efflux RND transporter periplasmic adaptor subunit n=1 Tax=Teredinibacter waterburyi TaxID=1500538 RepID=UPI00165F3065|nr:efflux RND transporter periplasmic adaptor subunit [Teredinibacter waterburyi]
MLKRILLTLAALLVLIAVLAGAKLKQFMDMAAAGESMVMPPTVIAASEASYQDWEVSLNAVGSLEAVQGVTVTADNPGRVAEIAFTAGADVEAGAVLIKQDISSEQAQLRAAAASVELAQANLTRLTELFKKKVASQAELDASQASYKQAVAQADTIRTSIEKKTIKAPFAGRLGIRLVNLGQDLATGGAIVSLQAVDPIYVNFSLPQQDMAKLKPGLSVRVRSDAAPGKVFEGKVTAINPEVDSSTRSLSVQATLANPDKQLLPGMFASVAVVMSDVKRVLAVPVTAVAYATYGDSIFVVTEKKDEKTGETSLVAQQQFVRLGKARGDFVSVEAGINEGDQVVSSGVFKLQNGAAVSINNSAMPEFSANPQLEDN